MERIVFASSNPGKLREFGALLEPLGIAIVPQAELGIADAEEPHLTFVENALAKARHASRDARLPAFADDSGICVAALGGAPGVHSARFAGVGADRATADAANNAKLVAALRGHADRRAHYMCVIVHVREPADPEPLVASGRWDGEVIDTARGAGGFGYDPHFFIPALGRTAAELQGGEKNRLSHRALAAARFVELLRER